VQKRAPTSLSPSASRRLLLAALCCLALLAAGRTASAQRSKPTPLAQRSFSPLEQERIRRALVRVHGKLDLEPEGKRIESIEIVTLEVFEPEDAVPQFVNWFHVTTRQYVIERELLFRVGGRYEQGIADETQRNLRDLGLFSVVLVLPMHGSSAGSVRYLVLTKDIWSLRVGWDGRINKGVVDYLSLAPTESNLFGTGRRLFASATFYGRTFTLGAGFIEPRLAGSRTRLEGRFNTTLNCQTGELEGSSGSFDYSRPLYSTSARWAYGTSVSWSNGRSPLQVVLGNSGAGAICSVRAEEELAVGVRPEIPVEDRPERFAAIPNRYQYDSQSFSQAFTRSYGTRLKTNLSFGLEASRVAYRGVSMDNLRSLVGAELTPYERYVAERRYRSLIPRGEQRINPFFLIQSYDNVYQPDLNAETLSLQEDFRMGHLTSLRIYPALEALGSSRNLLGLQAFASYTRPIGTGFLRGSVNHVIELSRPDQSDGSLSFSLRFNSPRFLLGRVVYDARLIDHYLNYRRLSPYSLGGTGRLRGYENVATSGQHVFVNNLEFRSRPLQLFSTQLAGALFYDMGDAFERFSDIHLLHGVGAGIRFLAPQLDRDVFRIDLGFPVPANAERGEISVMATFGQAFGVPQ
jgi:outer membrane protein assembly factor BamA